MCLCLRVCVVFVCLCLLLCVFVCLRFCGFVFVCLCLILCVFVCLFVGFCFCGCVFVFVCFCVFVFYALVSLCVQYNARSHLGYAKQNGTATFMPPFSKH